ncbi:MAG TPA: DUF5684 domain-containing protein [Phycisphaerales bacterium]|nr:DUF5684 domain-containing protein [Phycisphaerales bacterium]
MMTNLITLAQQQQGGGGEAAGAIVGLIFFVFWLAVLVLVIAGLWKVFAKAGQPGWAAIVPIYNMYVWTKVVGRPWWWLLLMFIPIVSLVIAIILCLDLAKSFGKGVGFGIGLALLGFIFIPLLGFGSDKYVGPAAAGGAGIA